MQFKPEEITILNAIQGFYSKYLISSGSFDSYQLFLELDSCKPIEYVSAYKTDLLRGTEHEWLLDYLWYKRDNRPLSIEDENNRWQYFSGLQLACEVEWSYPNSFSFWKMLEDLQKLMVTISPIKFFVTQVKKELNSDCPDEDCEMPIIRWLTSRLLIDEFECIFVLLPVKNHKQKDMIVYKIQNCSFIKMEYRLKQFKK